jgi:polysaccharide pyruvyl transferase WcaK-like protein
MQAKPPSHEQAPELVITAVTLSGNKGAEGMFWALYNALSRRYPGVRFHVASYYPEQDKARAPERVSVCSATPRALVSTVFAASLAQGLLGKLGLALPSWLLPGFPRAVKKSGLLLDAAGVSFSDGREKFLPFNLLTMLPAVLMGTPAIKCSQALGPFQGRINRKAASWFLPKLKQVFARGAQTLEHLEGLQGVNTSLASDLVFLLEPEELPPAVKLPPRPASGAIIGISPSSLVESKCAKRGLDYCGTLAGFIESLLRDSDDQVILIPHSIRSDSDEARNNDLPTCRRIMELLGPRPGCTLVEEELSPAQLKTVIRACDYFVASRFHSMVGALSGQVPLIVCGWGHKYLEVLDEFGLAHLAFDFGELCFDTLRQRFDWLRGHGGQVRQNIGDNLPRLQEQAARQIDYICRLIDEQQAG